MTHPDDIGCADELATEIIWGDQGPPPPTKVWPFVLTDQERYVIREYVGKLKEQGIIEEGFADCVSNVFIISKKQYRPGLDLMQCFRPVVDLRPINHYQAIPTMANSSYAKQLLSIGQEHPKYFMVLNISSGFHNIPIKLERDRRKLGIISPIAGESLRFARLPMGAKYSPYLLMKQLNSIMTSALKELNYLYMDDLLIKHLHFAIWLACIEVTLMVLRRHHYHR